MKNKHFFTFFLTLLLFVSCSGKTPVLLNRTEFALGTYCTVKIYGMSEGKANSALKEAFARLSKIESIASAKNPDSELFYVNENAYGNGVVAVSEELFALLYSGLFYSRLTEGAFDITLGAIVELWGIGTENARIPSPEEIAVAVENSGYEHLLLNEAELSVRFLKSGLKVDLGAFAKGYAADEMQRVLIEHGVENAIIDLGGDIITIGGNNGAGWRIGLTDPQNTGEVCAVLRVSDKAIVTSGDYERYFMHEGKRYHHIFDRNTGYPAESGLRSATVAFEHMGIHGAAIHADALSTAFFVMGKEKAVEFVSTFQQINYILIDDGLNFTFSEGLDLEIIK